MSDYNYLVFDKIWFKKFQKPLLWLLNSFGTKIIFRNLLGIKNYDISLNKNIINIGPDFFSFDQKLIYQNNEFRIQKTTDFRTIWKYSKNIYKSFKYIWWGMHLYDSLFADRFVPQLSFGFSTLTAYPQAGSGGGNVTCDGNMGGDTTGGNITWATLVALTNADIISTTGNSGQIMGWNKFGSNFNSLYRGGFSFDTSSLTSGAIISAAVLSLWGTSKGDSVPWNPDIDIYTWNPTNANDIVYADFSQCGIISQTGSPISMSNFNSSGTYNDFIFNTFANILKTGISAFCTRNANYEVAGNTPSGGFIDSCQMSINFSDYSGGIYSPKLVITYSLTTTYTKDLNLDAILQQINSKDLNLDAILTEIENKPFIFIIG